MAPQEFVLDDGEILIEDRVVEVFSDVMEHGVRIHVRRLGFEVFPPDKHGRMNVHVGYLVGDDVSTLVFLTTTDQSIRDGAAIALEAARQRGLAG